VGTWEITQAPRGKHLRGGENLCCFVDSREKPGQGRKKGRAQGRQKETSELHGNNRGLIRGDRRCRVQSGWAKIKSPYVRKRGEAANWARKTECSCKNARQENKEPRAKYLTHTQRGGERKVQQGEGIVNWKKAIVRNYRSGIPWKCTQR